MGKTIDTFTQDVRKRKWTELLISCNNSGQSKVEWCKEQGVTKHFECSIFSNFHSN